MMSCVCVCVCLQACGIACVHILRPNPFYMCQCLCFYSYAVGRPYDPSPRHTLINNIVRSYQGHCHSSACVWSVCCVCVHRANSHPSIHFTYPENISNVSFLHTHIHREGEREEERVRERERKRERKKEGERTQ